MSKEAKNLIGGWIFAITMIVIGYLVIFHL